MNRYALPEEPTYISVNMVKDGDLPDGAVGVHWVETNWKECAGHIEDPSWIAMDSDRMSGIVIFDKDMICDICMEGDE